MTMSRKTVCMCGGVGGLLFYFKIIVPWKPVRQRDVFLLLLNMKDQRVVSALADANFTLIKAVIENSCCLWYVNV